MIIIYPILLLFYHIIIIIVIIIIIIVIIIIIIYYNQSLYCKVNKEPISLKKRKIAISCSDEEISDIEINKVKESSNIIKNENIIKKKKNQNYNETKSSFSNNSNYAENVRGTIYSYNFYRDFIEKNESDKIISPIVDKSYSIKSSITVKPYGK